MSTHSPPRAMNLLKTAQSEYVVSKKGLTREVEDASYSLEDEMDAGDAMSDNASIQSDTRADLTVLGVDLDDETIARLESNLGTMLFNTASKAAHTLRVAGSMRSKTKEGQTPMGHLVDESYMNMKFLGNDITDISMVAAPKEKSNGSAASPAAALPQSITMSTSFRENEEHFLPLAGAGLDTSIDNSTDRKLFEDEMVGFEESEPNTPPSEAADSRVNHSLDHYRKKRSLFKTDLNELLGSDDEGDEEHKGEEVEHAYLDVVNVGAAYSIEPEVRSQLDKLLIALQIDYMKNPDKFVKRLFGFPLNGREVNMGVVNKVRLVGESGFFEALRRIMRGYYKDGGESGGGTDYDKRMENELIYSLYQLVVEQIKPRGEKERRPVVDLWKFVRKFRTGDRLRGERCAVTREEKMDQRLRSGFYKLDKTNAPIPKDAHRVHLLEREVASRNAEIEDERKDTSTIAWRNRSPPRHHFSTEGQSMYDSVFIPRPPRKESMLQILNYDVSEKARGPIDDDYHARKATNIEKTFESSSHLMASRLTQREADNQAKGHVRPRRAHKINGGPARPWEESIATVLHRHDFAKSEHGYIEKSELRKRKNSAFNSSSVADALHGKADEGMHRRHRKGAFFSEKAIYEANKSGESERQRIAVESKGVSTVTNQVAQEKLYLHNVESDATSGKGDMSSLLVGQ